MIYKSKLALLISISLFFLISSNLISATLPTPTLQDNSGWKVTHTTDIGYFSWFQNSSQPNTYACLLSSNATKMNELGSPQRNLYNLQNGRIATLNAQQLNVQTSGLDRNYFGWCRNIRTEELIYYKLGENSTTWEWVDSTLYIYPTDTIELEPYTLEILFDGTKQSYPNLKWFTEDTPIGIGVEFEANINNFTQRNNITFRQNKLEEKKCSNNFYKQDCQISYIDYSSFESLNNITSKNINANYPTLLQCVAERFPLIWQFYDCLQNPNSFDITYFGNITNLDPALQVTHTTTTDQAKSFNQTEITDTGIRTLAPVLYFNFNSNNESGGYLIDNSIQNNFGTVGGNPLWSSTNGLGGTGAYNFDGSDDSIEIKNNPTMNMINGFSICTWVYPESTGEGTFGRIYDYGNTGGHLITMNNSEQIIFSAIGGNSILSSVGAVPLNQWTHVCIKEDSGKGYMFINGILNSNGTMVFTAPDTDLSIGNNQVAGARTFDGYIDEFKFYGKSLATEEILNIYNNQSGKYFKQGTVDSLIFYNSTGQYWNTTLSLADTYNNKSGVVLNGNLINTSNINLLAYYKLDNNYLDTQTIYNGTAIGTRNSTGLNDGAIYFDGIDDYVNISTFTSTAYSKMSGGFTLSSWVNLKGTTGGILSNLVDISLATDGIEFRVSGNDANLYIVQDGTSVNRIGRVSNGDYVTSNTWHHIVATWNGTLNSASINIYIDGVLHNDATGDVGTFNAFETDLVSNMKIGYDYLSSGVITNEMNGSIDEVLIYNTTLTQEDITKLYKSGLSKYGNTNVSISTRTANTYNITDPSLVSFWSMNGNANDEKGINNGTASGAVANSTSGIVGDGYWFDGINDYIDVGNSSSLQMTTNLTISTWIKLFKLPSGSEAYAIVARDNVTTNRAYQLRVSPISQIQFPYFVSNSVYYFNGTTTVFTNRWYHVAVTINGNNAVLYLNGNVDNSATLVGNIDNDNVGMNIGRRNDGASTSYFNGTIDEVRIYNRSLSASEVLDLYNFGATHISDWSDWTSQDVMTDNIPQGSSSSGKFFQVRPNFWSNTTEATAYLINHSISTGSQWSPPTPPAGSICGSNMIGNGTLIDPCIITNQTQLSNVTYNLTAYYVLGNDINLSGTFTSIGVFKGDLNGQNKTIRNLNNVLFNETISARLKDLALTNVSITTTYSAITKSATTTNFTRMYVDGQIDYTSLAFNAFFSGETYGYTRIEDCYVNGNVSSSLAGVSGFIGYMDEYSIINNSYFVGNLTEGVGGKRGGLVSRMVGNSKIYNSFTDSNAGLVDTIIAGTITNSYWNNRTDNPDTCYSGGDTGCTAINDNSNYFKGDVYPISPPMSSWQFFSVWQERINDYPSLTWQELGGDYDLISPTWKNNKTNLEMDTAYGSTVYFNITLNDETQVGGNYIFEFYNGTSWINDSVQSWTNNTEIKVEKVTNINNGWINWSWWFNDSVGNYNQTTMFSQNIQSPPIVTILYPTNNTTYTTLISQVNYTAEFAIGGDRCWYSLDRGITNSTSVTALTNFTSVPFVEGNNNLTVYCNGTSGMIGSDYIIFTIDLAPTLTINSPTAGSVQDLVFKLNMSCIDTMGVSNRWYNWKGVNYTYTNVLDLYSSAGSQTIIGYCNDTIGNLANITRTFTTRDFDTNASTFCTGGQVHLANGSCGYYYGNQSGSGTTSSTLNTCRYKKLLYYNTKLSWMRQGGCI